MKKIFIVCLLLATIVFAKVTATVNKNEVVRGDTVTLNLSTDANTVKFPMISNIDGYAVQSTGESQSISIINGTTNRTLTKSYVFVPLKSITIPSYKVMVDGKTIKTKPIKIKVIAQANQAQNQNFMVKMISSKNKVYVGEPITLKIIFKQKRDVAVEGIQFVPPKFSGFWVKSTAKDHKEMEGNYIVHNITYVLIPQQAGKLKITPVKVSIAKTVYTQDPFAFMMQEVRWKNIYSNELDIDVKPLPQGVSVYGHFNMTGTVDKKVVKANEPVNFTLNITGSGDIDDIGNFKLQIPGTTIYANPAKRSTYLEGHEYKGKFTQKFAIIADKSYTIPSLKFSYFDKNSKTVKTITTKAILIKVKGATTVKHSNIIQNKPLAKTLIKTKIIYKEKNSFTKWVYLCIGFFTGFLIAIFPKLMKKDKTENSHPISYKIKHSKNDKELLKILLPFAIKNIKIKEIVEKLEENIYMNKSHKINKKELSKNIEKILNPCEEEEL